MIIEQPKSTNFYEAVNNKKFTFNIETNLDDTENVSYEWYSGDTRYSTDRVFNYDSTTNPNSVSYSFNSLEYQYFYCRVTNTEPEGVNGKNSVSTDSRKVVLEKWWESNPAVNQRYCLQDAKVCFNGTEFVANREKGILFPTPDQFYVERTYLQEGYHAVSSFKYYDNEEYNIQVEPVDNYDCYGNVPYIVTYTIPQHKIEDGTIVPAETYKIIVYINTVFENVPVVNEPTYAFYVNTNTAGKNYCLKRKYDFVNKKFYVIKESGNYEEFTLEEEFEFYLRNIVLEELYTTVHYYNNNTITDSTPVKADEFNKDSMGIPEPVTNEDFIDISSRAKVGKNNSWEIKEIIPERTKTYDMHPYRIRYYLSQEDFKSIENGDELKVYIEVINSVSKGNEKWVKNKEPVISSMEDQMIYYSRYD